MRTTIVIDKEIAARVSGHAQLLGNRSMGAMVEFLLRKSCDFLETRGYDEFVKIPDAGKRSKNK